jgi:hypothetical protein
MEYLGIELCCVFINAIDLYTRGIQEFFKLSSVFLFPVPSLEPGKQFADADRANPNLICLLQDPNNVRISFHSIRIYIGVDE